MNGPLFRVSPKKAVDNFAKFQREAEERREKEGRRLAV